MSAWPNSLTSSTGDGNPRQSKPPAMLNNYISNPPTITEKIALGQASPAGMGNIASKEKETGLFLDAWQLAWEQNKKIN